MELKRIAPKPNADQPSLAPLIPIRVIKAPARPVRARRPRRLSLDTFFTRVLASSLLVSLPAMVILASLMFAQELQSSTDLANGRAESSATGAAERIAEWVSEPASYLAQLARESIVPAGRAGPNGTPLKTAVDP